MFDSIGGLRNYRHVVAFASEVKPGKSIKRSLYGRSLLIWRSADGNLRALDDCCPHQRTPIDVDPANADHVVCPYHGWRFDCQGTLIHVPSDPEFANRSPCRIPGYHVQEADGFVWLLPQSQDVLSETPAVASSEFVTFPNWPAVTLQQTFQTTDERLIDNFMDPTHTAVVHDGVIRSEAEIGERSMTITTDETGVRVEHSEQQENVGPGSGALFPKMARIKHVDEFLLPNLVRVTYTVNDRPRFQALIGCTPMGMRESAPTEAFVQLRYDFRVPHFLAGPILRRLAKKVIRQDLTITEAQYENSRRFAEQTETKVAADAVAIQVRRLRQKVISGAELSPSTPQNVRVWF